MLTIGALFETLGSGHEHRRDTMIETIQIILPNGKTIIDERCTCGALKSQHAGSLVPGHGPMPDGSCNKFTWMEFIFASDTEVNP